MRRQGTGAGVDAGTLVGFKINLEIVVVQGRLCGVGVGAEQGEVIREADRLQRIEGDGDLTDDNI